MHSYYRLIYIMGIFMHVILLCAWKVMSFQRTQGTLINPIYRRTIKTPPPQKNNLSRKAALKNDVRNALTLGTDLHNGYFHAYEYKNHLTWRSSRLPAGAHTIRVTDPAGKKMYPTLKWKQYGFELKNQGSISGSY